MSKIHYSHSIQHKAFCGEKPAKNRVQDFKKVTCVSCLDALRIAILNRIEQCIDLDEYEKGVKQTT